MSQPSLATHFAGIASPNPFWLASAPPTNSAYQVLKAFEAGWGGAVWKTLTDSPIVNVSSRYGALLGSKPGQVVGLNNLELISEKSVAQNCAEMAEVKQAFPERALLASLMFETESQWQEAVRRCEETAGVDGFELNFGCPHGLCERGMGSTVGQNAELCERITGWVTAVATKPVLVKLTPNVASMVPMALAVRRAGANGVSLINTLNSVVGVDLETLVPLPSVGQGSSHGGYAGPAVKPIALHHLSEVLQAEGFTLPISGIGGIGTWQDAAEFVALGATSLQIATAVMLRGFDIITPLTLGLQAYLHSKGLPHVEALRGQALPKLQPWHQLNLNHKVVAHVDAATCIACQKCVTVCDDAAYQAFALPTPGAPMGVPVVLEEACVGCNLCSYVCPVAGCITMQPVATELPPLNWQQHPRNTGTHTL